MWMLLCCDASGQAATYTVKPGDSLSKIARVQGCTVEALAKANGIKLSAFIQAGQTLKIPGKPATATTGGSHTIQPGDTFSSISRQYGVPVASLLAANPGLNPKSLKPGQKVILTEGSKQAETKPVDSRGPSPTPPAGVNEKPASSTTQKSPDATPAATPGKPPADADPQPAAEQVRTITVDTEMTYGEFAKQHGTNIQRLNELNGLDLTEAMVLAKGSELYVPTRP